MINLKLKTVTALALLITGGATQAKYAPITENLEKDLVNICQAIKDNHKIRIRKAIKHSGFTKRHVSEGLVCNGMEPLEFALFNNAIKSAEYIAGKSHLNAAVLAYKNVVAADKENMIQ